MDRVLTKTDLGAWAARLDGWTVIGPVPGDEGWVFEPVVEPAALRLDHSATVAPAKSVAFPQREVFYHFRHPRGGAPEITATVPDPAPTVVFGVRPCDGRAAGRNDTVFTKEFEDPYYWARRKRSALVGLTCATPPSLNCFCLSVGGAPHSEEGLDVLMTDLGARYFVCALTDAGRDLVAAGGELLAEATDDDRAARDRAHADALTRPQRCIEDLARVPAGLEAGFDSAAWPEMARACIGCGICTFLCPTCHCFDINDEVTGSAPVEGRRVRTWDTCQFPDFTMHASGHNPRPDPGSRLRQRICHKFLYFFQNHDAHQCVGCGRCVTHCPVGIDIVAVVNRVAHHAR